MNYEKFEKISHKVAIKIDFWKNKGVSKKLHIAIFEKKCLKNAIKVVVGVLKNSRGESGPQYNISDH